MRSKFGVLIGQSYPWEEMVRHVQSVESAGFDSVWIADHFANPFAETDWFEAWTTLAGLAATTQRIRLGTLVTSIVYRHPAVVAKQAVTVDHISNGRICLGIGAGGVPTCHSMTGTSYWSGKERQDRLAEFVSIVAQLLSEERSSFTGEFYSAEDALMLPHSVQKPRLPLLIAAHGPRSLKVAAEYGDTWSFFEPGEGLKGKDAATAVSKMNEYVDEKAAVAGRDPETITRSFCCGFSASSSWNSLDEALSDITLFEKAGVNEFIFNYLPDVALERELNSGDSTGRVSASQFLGSENDLRNIADALSS
jgi:alkanesulfonate monooxygenase SsuD/methylene tetrahydromethanopterin reductase-like flavin-dependent oxidoreductase (luciferase family)